jgi:hypothetical protein
MYIDVQAQSRINNNDIVIFRNGKWTTVHKGIFLGEVMSIMNNKEEQLIKENEVLKKEIEDIKNDLQAKDEQMTTLIEAVNTKLKEYHDVLNTLTGAKK